MPKVFIVGKDGSVYSVFHRFGWEITATIQEADLVQYTGGEDIDPRFYQQHPHNRTYTSEGRNTMEYAVYRYARNLGKPQAGICRGGQLLNALCGGDMWQDVDNHSGHHDMIDKRNGTIHRVNSIHHQMMIPGKGADVICVAHESKRREKMSKIGGERVKIVQNGIQEDPELIWYPLDECFCFQGHPEYAPDTVGPIYFDYVRELMKLGV